VRVSRDLDRYLDGPADIRYLYLEASDHPSSVLTPLPPREQSLGYNPYWIEGQDFLLQQVVPPLHEYCRTIYAL
jgi:hypothetical protein